MVLIFADKYLLHGVICQGNCRVKVSSFNPYKIGPSSVLIKNGLLGRFPTLRKDDADVESSRPPPLPPSGPVGYLKVGGLFSAFSRLRIMLKSNQKHRSNRLAMMNLNMLLKVLYDDCDENGDKKCVRDFNFSAADCLQVFDTGPDSGGEGGCGRKTARSESGLCQYEYVWGTLGFFYIF